MATEIRSGRERLAVMAGVLWAAMPIAWAVAAGFEGDGEGSAFAPFYMLGWVALVAAGALLLLAVRKAPVVPGRAGFRAAATVVHALGVVLSLVFFWAVFLWAGLYAVAMAMYAYASPAVRRPAVVIAGTMVLAIGALTLLTALKVGTPDPTYGDYPIAWFTSYVVAGLGAAAGSFLLSGRLDRVSRTVSLPA